MALLVDTTLAEGHEYGSKQISWAPLQQWDEEVFL